MRLRPNESRALAWKESHLFPNMMSQTENPLKPACLAIARLRPTESRAFGWKESHLFPNMMSQTENPLKPACLAIRPTESRAFGWKENHLFPTWWAKQQETPETKPNEPAYRNLAILNLCQHETKRLQGLCVSLQSVLPPPSSRVLRHQVSMTNLEAKWLRKGTSNQPFSGFGLYPCKTSIF